MTDTPNQGQESQSSAGQHTCSFTILDGRNLWTDGAKVWNDGASAVRSVVDYLRPPAEVEAHFRAARVEMLKAVRAFLDQRIEKLSQTEHRGTKIPVE